MKIIWFEWKYEFCFCVYKLTVPFIPFTVPFSYFLREFENLHLNKTRYIVAWFLFNKFFSPSFELFSWTFSYFVFQRFPLYSPGNKEEQKENSLTIGKCMEWMFQNYYYYPPFQQFSLTFLGKCENENYSWSFFFCSFSFYVSVCCNILCS